MLSNSTQKYVRTNHSKKSIKEMAAHTGATYTNIRKFMIQEQLPTRRSTRQVHRHTALVDAIKSGSSLKHAMAKTGATAQQLRMLCHKLQLPMPSSWQAQERGSSLKRRVEARIGRMLLPRERLLFKDGNKRSKDLDNVAVLSDKKALLSASKSLKAAAYAAVRAGVITYNVKKNTYEFRK